MLAWFPEVSCRCCEPWPADISLAFECTRTKEASFAIIHSEKVYHCAAESINYNTGSCMGHCPQTETYLQKTSLLLLLLLFHLLSFCALLLCFFLLHPSCGVRTSVTSLGDLVTDASCKCSIKNTQFHRRFKITRHMSEELLQTICLQRATLMEAEHSHSKHLEPFAETLQMRVRASSSTISKNI